MIEQIKQCTSFTEVGRILGYDYYNGRVRKNILKKCSELGINIEQQIQNYKERKVYCLECGEELTGNDRFRKKFCDSSCAATYNNKLRGPKSEDEREKISHSLFLHYGWNEDEIQKFTGNERGVSRKRLYGKECPTCHKQYKGYKAQIYCSPKCAQNSTEVKQKLREKQLEKVANGTHSGWKSRNIISYPEKFWMEVLKNNNIEYTHEDFSTKKYFLDFLIYKNDYKIDLEIDGNQHSFRKEHDKKRDEYLTANGFIVYRIPWNSINTDKGKERMKEKIDRFLEFYQNLQ